MTNYLSDYLESTDYSDRNFFDLNDARDFFDSTELPEFSECLPCWAAFLDFLDQNGFMSLSLDWNMPSES